MQRAGEVRVAPVRATRWDGVAQHAQAHADEAFTTAVDRLPSSVQGMHA